MSESKGRYQKIKYDIKGIPYVTYKGTRLNLCLFQANAIGEYYYCNTFFSAYKLDVDVNGEFARVTFEKVG